jgi:hypothetical protein
MQRAHDGEGFVAAMEALDLGAEDWYNQSWRTKPRSEPACGSDAWTNGRRLIERAAAPLATLPARALAANALAR